MEQGWTKVYSSADPVKLEMLKGLLDAENILAVVINKKDSSYLFGESELYVNADDAISAIRIITNAEI